MTDGVHLRITEYKKNRKTYQSEIIIPNGNAAHVELVMRVTFNIVQIKEKT
jgi:hypothetical protein